MEGTAQIRVASRSVFGGVEDVIRMEGTAAVEKTEYGWHLQYEAVNCEDEKATLRSDVKLETDTGRAIVVNEGEGYGLLLDPAAVTATQIKTPQGSLTLNVPGEGLYLVVDSDGLPIIVGTKINGKDLEKQALGTAAIKSTSISVDKEGSGDTTIG